MTGYQFIHALLGLGNMPMGSSYRGGTPAKRARVAGSANPAGSKLSRMAGKRRIGLSH